MKRNKLMEEIRRSITPEMKKDVDFAFRISDRIYAILQQQGKTQCDLAKAMGKSESEISKWLSGSHNFTFQTIARIEKILGVPIIEVTGKQVQTEQECVQTTMLANKECSFLTNSCFIPGTYIGKDWVHYSNSGTSNSIGLC